MYTLDFVYHLPDWQKSLWRTYTIFVHPSRPPIKLNLQFIGTSKKDFFSSFDLLEMLILWVGWEKTSFNSFIANLVSNCKAELPT